MFCPHVPDVKANIFLSNKDTPISAINDAVILLKTRKARERRLRAATRALPGLNRTIRRAHTATGADVSRRNLSISAIENSGLRSAAAPTLGGDQFETIAVQFVSLHRHALVWPQRRALKFRSWVLS